MSPVLDRLLSRVVPLALALGVLMSLRYSGMGVAAQGPESTTVAVGFMLLAAFVGGKVAARMRLPRITGYLGVGFVIGPYVSGLITRDMLFAVKAVEGVAVALIALTAGGEIQLDWVKRHARRLALITSSQVLLVTGTVLATVLLARPVLPFMPAGDLALAVVIAMVFGTIAAASSPTVTIAVIAENKAEGPLARTVLGVTIIKDVATIVLFAVALTVAKDLLGEGGGEALGTVLTRELGGSVLVGIGFGVGLSLFMRHVARDTPVFVLALCFAIWQVATTFQLETLLIALTAGLWVENFSHARGEDLIKAIERLSLPVYALFFAAAGAKVNVPALAALWPFALLLASVRALCLWAGTRLGATLARAEPAVRRYAWLGFVSQAGVTLALSTIVAREFPTWGADVQALIVAMIAIHELIGPIGFQFALGRVGEVGAARQDPEEPVSAGRLPQAVT
ncbi:MAG: cation:proton antiporter [Polyangiaceae bacterium]|nr:cation:proton antiporter [Polyangiaceae bacterium]